MFQAILVVTNVPSAELASAIATCLVEQGLAACVNILPAVQSVYRWQGKVEQAVEIPLLIKTTETRYGELQAAIRALHPYDIPEIIAINIDAGLPAYLNWIGAETVKALNV
ncbi:periplasmic divalent cation tolerance protein [Herbaspirillum sp. Sphag1AN]|uniref:divalent-cation tolerance protein CutA n=1 Tax=unclassified Herbaspirillum TaxID=2624150 RepID=UPI00161DC6FA|nr:MULTISPECIES: divalent-cation tolerance protein CutA [unclassified Herbaspirillum]MBB3214744.1 periplasmic divalent cation tolerance protein [Herbaspirillum sp. Sphag1AN]MBB3247940.1 periplasmic divalent cation tolerance protein [Herbaspirillum sp. Sphag64]